MTAAKKGKQPPKKKAETLQKKEFLAQGWVPYAMLFLVFILYSGVFKNGFAGSWDDELYLVKDTRIQHLNLKNFISIFTQYHAGNYHPLTTLVHSLEWNLFGLNPRGYHVFSLLLHLLNTWLVFRFSLLLLKKRTPALIVSVLFAVHPMHVESVAWFAETKDLLYTTFYLAALISYLKYVSDPGLFRKKYYAALVFFLLSLLSKSMAVTLPLVMLAMDVFLGRGLKKKVWFEKIPFFLLSLLFGVIALLSQKAGGAIDATADTFHLLDRILLAGYAVGFYIVKMIFPFMLSAYHPFPVKNGEMLPTIYFVATLLVLLASVILWRIRATAEEDKRMKRQVVFGLLVFLLSVLPVLQLIPVGMAGVAERYTYFPYIGLFIAVVGITQGLADKKKKEAASYAGWAMAGFVVLFSILTWQQIRVWRDLSSLFTQVVSRYPENAMSQYNLGHAFQERQDAVRAVQCYSEAIRYNPSYVEAYNNRGALYLIMEQPEKAVEDFTKAIVLRNDTSAYGSYLNRGIAYHSLKNYNAAEKDFSYLLSRKPDYVKALYLRGQTHLALNRPEEACSDWKKAESFGFAKATEALKEHCR